MEESIEYKKCEAKTDRAKIKGCGEIKPINEFGLDAGRRRHICKECNNKDRKKYYDKNREKLLEQKKEYYITHKEEIVSYRIKNEEKIKKSYKKYYEENIEAIKKTDKKYYEENRETCKKRKNKYEKNRRKIDPAYKLRCYFSSKIGQALKNNDGKKNESFLKKVGYTMEESRLYIESQFEWWMTWDNWGIYDSKIWDKNNPSTWTWHVDHIIPVSTFNCQTMDDEDFKVCWGLSNLRPLSAKQNHQEGVSRIRHNDPTITEHLCFICNTSHPPQTHVHCQNCYAVPDKLTKDENNYTCSDCQHVFIFPNKERITNE